MGQTISDVKYEFERSFNPNMPPLATKRQQAERANLYRPVKVESSATGNGDPVLNYLLTLITGVAERGKRYFIVKFSREPFSREMLDDHEIWQMQVSGMNDMQLESQIKRYHRTLTNDNGVQVERPDKFSLKFTFIEGYQPPQLNPIPPIRAKSNEHVGLELDDADMLAPPLSTGINKWVPSN